MGGQRRRSIFTVLSWWLDGARKIIYPRKLMGHVACTTRPRLYVYTAERVDSGNCTPGTTPARARILANIDPQPPVIPSRAVEWKFNFRAFSAGTSFSDRSLDSQEIVRHKRLVFATWVLAHLPFPSLFLFQVRAGARGKIHSWDLCQCHGKSNWLDP